MPIESHSWPVVCVEQLNGMADGPNFRDIDAAPSSAHKEYHPRAIQIHGRARFEGKTANQVKHILV